MSEQLRKEQLKQDQAPVERATMSPFVRADAPPVIIDPYAVPIEEINVIDGRLFEQDLHLAHF